MVVVSFAIIALMRVIQKVCSKKVSNRVAPGVSFFRYGGYYQLVAAAFALLLLCFIGFHGATGMTVLCALATAVLFAVDLFTSLEAIKGASLVVCNMFATGGLFVPCILGIFLFDEPMSVWQWVGLLVFVVSIYFLSAKEEKTEKAFTAKTLIMLIINFVANGLVMVVQKYFAIFVPDGVRNEAMYSFLTFGLNAVIMYGCMGALLLYKVMKKKSVSVGLATQTEGELATAKTDACTVETQKRTGYKPMESLLLICGALLALAVFAINQLVTMMASTVPSVILFTVTSALTVIITCVVGSVVFKEKLTWKNVIGLVMGFAAIVIVNTL